MAKHILMIINQPFPYFPGGTQEKLNNQLSALHSRRVSVDVLAANSKEKKAYFNPKAQIENIGLNYKTFDNSLFLKVLYWAAFHFVFVILAFRTSLGRDYDLIEVKDPYSGIAGVLIKGYLKIPLVLETAGAFGFKMSKLYNMKFGSFKSKVIYFFLRQIEKFVYSRCDAIITEDDCEEYMRGLGFKGIYKRIPNGVDTKKFKNKNIPHSPAMLYLGRINPEKNVDYIIKNKPEGKLIIVGNGLNETRCKELAAGREDVVFEGFRENTQDYYNKADVLVMASSYESLPCVVLEAMSCGIPVVSTKVGMIPEVIEDGKNGFLYDLENLEDFKSKVVQAMQNKELGVNARRTVEEKYDWRKIIRSYLEIYNEL